MSEARKTRPPIIRRTEGAEEVSPVGRPTKYDAKNHPPIIRKLAARGMTEEDMASILGVAVSTFSLWKVQHPEFSEAVAEGKAQPIREVEAALFQLAVGYDYEENGRQRVKHPDIRAIEFYLKNVAPELWRDTQRHEHVGTAVHSTGFDLRADLLARLAGQLDEEGSCEDVPEPVR